MNGGSSDPRCPECGEPIGLTATYCMHCSADLTEERRAADTDEDGVLEQSDTGWTDAQNRDDGPQVKTTDTEGTGQLLDPDGLVDNTLTAIVGIIGGLVVGVVGTVVLLIVTGNGWAVAFGLMTWLAATAYLVRRRTVQAAVAKSSYAVAIVLLVIPVIALSPLVSVDGGIEERGGLFVMLLLFAAVPAGIAVGIGWVAAQYIPEDASSGEG